MPATAMLLCMGLFSIFWLKARAASALAAVFPVDDRSMACQAVAREPRSPPSPDGLRRGSLPRFALSVSHRRDLGLRRKQDRGSTRCQRVHAELAAPTRSPAPRRPEQSKPLAFSDLIGRHFRRHRIAKPQIVVTLALGRMRRRQVEPFIREHDVLWYAVALVVNQAEPALPKRLALHGRSLIEIG